ncbi:MAG: DUF3871 family protein [Bacteroidetes bacterium]|nr:DUF3871 family protein [Bacteroidota bacterium]
MEIVKVLPAFTAEKAKRSSDDNFIVSNTTPVSLDLLKNECIIPNFSKDNESTISHSEFIEAVAETVEHIFSGEEILKPAIRVSHPIKGRIPSAMGKPAKLLSDFEKTLYYERMAFSIEIPTIRNTINGNQLSLTVGGVRAYNLENLYSRKSLERFKVFVGFKNHVCTNFCISTDGFLGDIRISKTHELIEQVVNLLSDFNVVEELNNLSDLFNYKLTETQFAHVVGKMKMYPFLSKEMKNGIVPANLGDSQLSAMVKSYYNDESFCGTPGGNINLFNFYNLCTGANKSSYIDSFLDRNVSQLTLTNELKSGLNKRNSSWYIQ